MATDYESLFQYELRQETAEGPHMTLYAAGHACTCPFQPVTPMQGPNGQMVAGRTLCNTSCPLAVYTPIPIPALERERAKEGEKWARFDIICGGMKLSRDVKVIPHSPIAIPKPAPLILL